MKLKEKIIKLMRRADYIPKTDGELLAELGLARRDRRKLAFELTHLLASGKIVKIKRDRFCLPSDANLATGRIIFRQSGSALVIPEVPADQPEPQAIQINAEDTGVAMHGDRVVARLYEPSEQVHRRIRNPHQRERLKGSPFGRVIRILERARESLTGNLQKTKLFHFVVPDDPRLVHDIYVSDPAESKLPVRPKIGDKVVVKLHEWTQRHVNPEGEIIEVLGRTNEPDAEMKAIFRKFNLPTEFPAPVLTALEKLPERVSAKDRRNRVDLRSINAFTIDPDDAKDFDDALSIESGPAGETRIGIHIADVSAYVQPGSPIDKEAQQRGNSTYLVGTVVPMLPEKLSNGLCSLKEQEDRLTKTVFVTFSSKGHIENVEFANSVIRSVKRLTYRQAYVLLTENRIQAVRELPMPPAHQTGSTGRAIRDLSDRELRDLQKWVRGLWKIAAHLRRERMKKGSLELDMPETKIFVDEKGYADRLEKIEYDESHQLIEEFMLLANEQVARHLRQANLPSIYRVHDEPDEDKLDELRETYATHGLIVGNLTRRKEVMKLLRTLKTHPQGHILRIQLLRSLKKAVYRSSPDGHYGLYKKDYTHFTSPIRRYSDLVVHRVFAYYLTKNLNQRPVTGSKSGYPAAKIASLGEHLSLTEQNSMEAERESVRIKLLEFFERECGKKKKTRFDAVILEVRNHGFFVELSESLAYGLVHASTLKDDLYSLNRDGSALVGRRNKRQFESGQHIQVVAERVDRFKRQIDFRVA